MESKFKDKFEVSWPVEFEQYERKIYDLRQLIEISKGLNSTLEYKTLIDSILFTCMGQMQLLKAGIFLKKGIGYENFTLHRNYKGFEVDHSHEYELESDSKTVEFIKHKIRCYELKDFPEGIRDENAYSLLSRLGPSLVVPLSSKGSLNGLIILGERINNKDFNETEKDYLLDIASLAGIAIHNAYLYEMATTDMMTNLKIHHFFQTSLIDEMERAQRFKKPLSLIMSDIDHFKKFNDVHGHIAGDIVLKNVAKIIKENTRPTDIAARYGGEEFAVILPKTDITEALIVAERIREFIEGEKIYFGEKALNVTISIGIAQYDPEMDSHPKNMVERADKALYLSKNNGRNSVAFL